MSEEMLSIINTVITILLPVLATLLTSVVSLLISKMKSKINSEMGEQVINNVVKYVEQVYKDLNGEEKLQKALETASLTLNEKGIKIGETELRTLVESAVYGLKQGLEAPTAVLTEGTIEETVENTETKIEE